MIPDWVRCQVRGQLEILKGLERARPTDTRFGGGGRYEGEVFLNNREQMERAWQELTRFEAICAQIGEDAQALYKELGSPEQLSAAAREWLGDRAPPPRAIQARMGGIRPSAG